MKYLRRNKNRLAAIAICGITITVFCIEHLSYLYNRSTWHNFNKNKDNAPSLRALFVADPQIQGEQQESFLYGWISRWDADRYLSKNYHLAKQHVSPDVVVFLGDLFDEGSIANDPEYRRYLQRFSTIFDLPTNQNPSPIKHIFVPGDNDVGGEKAEPVDPVKVKWFSKTFGDLRTVTNLEKGGLDVQFIKMNLFMPNEYKSPLSGFGNVINGTKKPNVRFIVSHVSLLSYMTIAVEQVLESFQPFLIFAAHSHKSSYLRHPKPKGGGKDAKTVHIIHDFLLSDKTIGLAKESLGNEPLYPQSSVRLDFQKSNVDIHEIIIPTCSYRMGVNHMGYGAMELYKNGTMTYTVLWLPSRFNQLFLYIGIYVIMKMILTPWILWKICAYIYRRFNLCNIFRRPTEYIKIV